MAPRTRPQATAPASRVEGMLASIRFAGRDFWTVASLRLDARAADSPGLSSATDDAPNGTITIVGAIAGVHPGDTLALSGSFTTHPKFGRQFRVESFSVTRPSSVEGVLGFLASRLPQVGRQRAEALVAHFGADKLFDVLAGDAARLTEVSGITIERAEAIHAAYLEVSGQRETIVALKELQLTDWQISKIVAKYGWGKCLSQLRSAPYELTEISGFGFKTVDAIALRLGVERDGLPRARAAVLWLLASQRDEAGHCYLPRRQLMRLAAQMLDLTPSITSSAVSSLASDLHVVVEDGTTLADARVYLASVHSAELSLAADIARLRKAA